MQDSIPRLSFDAASHVFSWLPIKELASCSLVSKEWLNICDNAPEWKNTARILRILQKEDNASDKSERILVGEHIKVLKSLAVIAEPLLDVKVKTAAEFDAIGYPIVFRSISLTDEEKGMLESLGKEQLDKMTLFEKIGKGFDANIILRRVGLSTWEKLYRFAILLKQKYGNAEAWTKLTWEKIEENDTEGALKISNTHLKNDYFVRMAINEQIIQYYCNKGQIIEAIDFYKKYCSEKRDYHDISSDVIFNRALDLKQFDAAERCIDEIDTDNKDSWKKSCHISYQISFLVDALLKENRIDKAQQCILKYDGRWELVDHAMDAVPRISRYVKAGFNEKAWNLALKWKNEDFVLKCFHKALLDNYQFEEAKKVEAMIQKE